MKVFVFTLFAVFMTAQAQATTLVCSSNQPTTILAAKVASGQTVKVRGVQRPAAGYRWRSAEGLPSRVVSGSSRRVGGSFTLEFTINTHTQSSRSKKYSFIYGRGFSGEVASRCFVTIVAE
ncbi:MAG: hypothetical protein AB7F59_02225 [Bdellovibrionales bacterium]